MPARWSNVPPASGNECAAALRRAGFHVDRNGEGFAVIQRDGVVLTRVPLCAKLLPPDSLIAILKAVGMSPARFTEYLDGAC